MQRLFKAKASRLVSYFISVKLKVTPTHNLKVNVMMVGGEKKSVCIEFTSADGFWLIAISVSSQAANTSPASPTSEKERQMRERSGGKIAPLSLLFTLTTCFSIIIHIFSPRTVVYHIRQCITIIAARSKQYVLMC